MDYTYDRADRLVVGQAYQTNVGAGLVPALNRTDREVTRLFYDGLGRRLAKEYDPKDGGGGVKRTEYVYDGLDPIVEYSLWNGQPCRIKYSQGQRDEFTRGAGAQLLTLRYFPAGTEGQSYWYHLDGRGSVAGLTKQQGQATHNYRYDAYGQLLPAHGNASTGPFDYAQDKLSAGFTDPHPSASLRAGNHYTTTPWRGWPTEPMDYNRRHGKRWRS